MMGRPFNIRTVGFGSYKSSSTWTDSMGTGILTMTGTADKTGKVITSGG